MNTPRERVPEWSMSGFVRDVTEITGDEALDEVEAVVAIESRRTLWGLTPAEAAAIVASAGAR